MSAVVNLAGQRFGRLVVLARHPSSTGEGKARWICLCGCGSVHIARGYRLRNGATKSCGCLASAMTHGGSSLTEYWVWNGMKQRCTNRNHYGWGWYGKRGIKVCPRWLFFEHFYADMGPRPGPDFWLERIDNNGNYEPANCCWATPKEQAQNRRCVPKQ